MTFGEFFAACDKLKAAGVSALGVGDSGVWASAHLFENTLLGVIGPQGWADLFSGKMKWDDPKVKQAMQYFAKMQDYLNPDHAALTWDQAVKELIEGKVGFTSMGDWADGELIKAHMKEKEDFGWVKPPWYRRLFHHRGRWLHAGKRCSAQSSDHRVAEEHRQQGSPRKPSIPSKDQSRRGPMSIGQSLMITTNGR